MTVLYQTFESAHWSELHWGVFYFYLSAQLFLGFDFNWAQLKS